jgi:hypothetical protein
MELLLYKAGGKKMNIAQQTNIFLANILENHKDLDFVSDGKEGGFDYHFKDKSKINIKEV